MKFTVARFPLGPAGFDPAAALEGLLSLRRSSQGVLMERNGELNLAAGPFEVLRVKNGRAWSKRGGRSAVLPGNPFDALGRRLAAFRAAGAPPFATGAAGWLGYEMSGYIEKLPLKSSGEQACVMLFDGWVRVVGGKAEYWTIRKGQAAFAEKIRRLLQILPPPPAPIVPNTKKLKPLRGVLGRGGFMRGVSRLKEHIRRGDIFQAVLAEPFSLPTRAGAAAVCRALRAASPSPYSFWIKDGETSFLGASPERLVAVVGGRAFNCPIAGTRPRGVDAKDDKRRERQMTQSPKERAEHLMLVDLARNDLGKVSAPGSVKVRNFMEVRRFSHVMHLVSEVEGRLDKKTTAWDALKASFPAGTVSGAPKVRAMELIAGLEPEARGSYAGAAIHHDFSGNLDSCLMIRSLRLKAGRARLQAGAGIVADSRPAAEYREVENKLLAPRRALALAETWSS